MNLFKQVRWGVCFNVVLVLVVIAEGIGVVVTWPIRDYVWGIRFERIRLDEQLRVARERYEHRQALPSSPSLNSLKSEGGE